MGLADTPESRKLAELKAAEIEKDILFERFDPTLEKYKPQARRLSLVTPVTPVEKSQLTLGELWEKYSEFKKPQVSPSTYTQDFRKHKNQIKRMASQSLDEASQIRDWLLTNLSLDAAKRALCQFNACCNWAVSENLIDINPFDGMRIKTPKSSSEKDIVPFTRKERNRIIFAFSTNEYYGHYTSLVKFLFFTGCRPSEAIALKWKNVTGSVIQFRNSVVVGENGLTEKEGLKTQKKRDFPITQEVKAILEEVCPEIINPESLVFPSPTGKFIDLHNLSSRAWRKVLESLPDIEYRKLYQTRHTFISLCIESGASTLAVARWCGTSVKMIDNHYGATHLTNLRPPNLS
jgi:integrase